MKNTLTVTTPSDCEIVMTRDFDAPRHLVWDAMTKPELIRRWLFLPPGWTMSVCNEDVRPGGCFRWEWIGPEGNTAMVMHGGYREVIPPAPDGSGGRIVRTETFEMGCTPMGDQHCTLVLTEKRGADGRPTTSLKLTVSYASKEARDGAIASGMEHGVATGYDQLEEMLTK